MTGKITKVKFYCDSGANIHSCRDQIFDLEELGYTEEEWEELTLEQKIQEAEEWANNYLDIGFEELP